MSSIQNSDGNERLAPRLSTASPEWAQIAVEHEKIERIIESTYNLPFEEFRKVPYRPPALPSDVPVPGQDIVIKELTTAVRDGHRIGVRVYRPIEVAEQRLLFFNIHGGGS